MNQPDANYWLNLAAQWIQSKSQTQVNFPVYQFSAIPQAPIPPRISSDNDNMVIDMEIEDVKDEMTQIWSDWKSETQTENIPVLQKNESRFSSVQIPSAPIISGESSRSSHQGDSSNQNDNALDMVLDSEDEHFKFEGDNLAMEAHKRKKLPLWIREGLERIEREKKQEVLRLEREKEMQKDEELRKQIMADAIQEIESEKTFSKSKYDSDSENEDLLKRDDETPDVQTKEDNFEKMMLLVRKTLTEILLEVTDEKIQEISKETLSRYPKKASSVVTKAPKISLGLGAYRTSSDEDSDGEKSEGPKSDVSEWESESELKRRIRNKELLYAKDIRERLTKIEGDEKCQFVKKRDETRENRDSDSDKSQKSKSRKNVGEEKFEQINSINGSFARQRDKKKTRFNDPKEKTSTILMTHVSMYETQTRIDNGSSSSLGPAPPQPSITFTSKKDKSKKRDDSTSSSSSSESNRYKKHKKKHKKSSKHSKKSSKKRDRSRDKRSRHSIDSRSSVRSSDSRRHRSRSRSRSRSELQNRSRRY